MTKKERYTQVIEWFKVNMPTAETELNYRTDFELLVAVILSAQCTDKRVNIVTPELFASYPTPFEMANALKSDILELISSISYPNSKSEYLHSMSKILVERHNGKVPDNMEELTSLPGVGRKTANVIMSVLFNKPTMAVDTHVFRVSERLGLTTNAKNPLQAERQLVKEFPDELIPKAHHWLILHGRYVCLARNPKCDKCGLSNFCKYYQMNKLIRQKPQTKLSENL